MRDRTAEDLGVQHAGQAQIVSVFDAAGDLGAALDARQRTPDLTGFGNRRHGCTAPSCQAACNARATWIRTSCFL